MERSPALIQDRGQRLTAIKITNDNFIQYTITSVGTCNVVKKGEEKLNSSTEGRNQSTVWR